MEDLQPYANQVGGHTTTEGKPSSLTDNKGKFYKPIQSEERFLREKQFYQEVYQLRADDASAHTTQHGEVCERLQAFVPRYYGSVEVEGKHHLVLEDLCWSRSEPCIMDVKIGFRTWYSWAPQKYIDKCKEKDEATTQSTIGLRVCGLQTYDPSSQTSWKADRHWGKNLTAATVDEAFLRYVPDGARVSREQIYTAAMTKLQDLKALFEEQKEFVFHAASVLLIYNGDAKDLKSADVRVCLVDFAHAYPGQGAIDDNFLNGLESLIKHISPLCGATTL